MTTKYIVHWRFNNKDCSIEFDSFTMAQEFRWKKIEEGYSGPQVTIHFKQLNKYGDTIIDNDSIEA